MSRTYEDPDRETDFERDERRLALEEDRRDRLEDYAPLPDKEPVLPRDISEWPAAQARIEALAVDYASVEVDRLPPMGALHWLVTGHKADGTADTFRVGAHGSLMPWPVKP